MSRFDDLGSLVMEYDPGRRIRLMHLLREQVLINFKIQIIH